MNKEEKSKEDIIYLNDYIHFDTDVCRFVCSDIATMELYRNKHIICSYSGCNEWCHDLFCQLLDLYSGGSKFNHSLGTVSYADDISNALKSGHQKEVIDWIERTKDKFWFVSATSIFADIIRNAPNLSD